MNTVRMPLAFSIVITAFVLTEGSGADIKILPPDRDDAAMVVISNRIEDGDAAAFRKAMARAGKMLVVLRGPADLLARRWILGRRYACVDGPPRSLLVRDVIRLVR